MTIDLQPLSIWVLGFLWPFFRVAAMLLATPIVGGRTLPARVRLVLALALTWAVLPLVGPVPPIDPLSVPGALVVLNQILIGAAMGLILQVAFAVLMVSGQMIGTSMGLGFAAVADPQNGVQVPAIGHFYYLLGVLVFFAVDGHLILIRILAESFVTLPVGAQGLAPDVFIALALWGGLMFSEAMRLALPVVSVILLTNLALGVATRAAPQLNVFAHGFALMLLLGFSAMLMTLGNLSPLFSAVLHRAFSLVQVAVGA
ncbi:flagellar biosynthetic protein FliR [Thioalkalicoccus limnaeus]|uniref:Flagellar biosynthetic protein FliR n=1 Tax=Thioalkalicoccus limnaeus TaxID=120681 RepID=A0ABV4BDL6_9GAMM